MTGRTAGRVRGSGLGIAAPIAQPEQHDYYLAFRRADLLAALLVEPHLVAADDRSQFLRLNRLLGSIFHVERLATLDAVRDLHHPVDPDITFDGCAGSDTFAERYETLTRKLVPLLRSANFAEVSAEEIERAHTEAAALQLQVSTPPDDFHDVRFFRRGRGLDVFDVKDWFGLRARKVDIEVYRTVVMIAAIKPEDQLDPPQRERLERANVRPGTILIKCYRDIASADLNVLLPNVRVSMSTLDKVMMAVPAVVGGVPIVLKLVSSLTVLFVVVGFYLGLRAGVHDEDLNRAIAALGALVALGAFVIRQWVKYERRSLKHLKELTDKVFLRSINQNAGFFDFLLSAVEDQDRKEALLAYAFLRASARPRAPSELRIEIENWIRRRFGLVVRFEVLDALDKLTRLRLVERSGDGYTAVPLEEAVGRVGRAWNDVHAGAEHHDTADAGGVA